MTVQDVIQNLESKGAVKVYQGTSYTQKDKDDNVVTTIHRVYFREPIGSDAYSKARTLELIEEGEEIKYHGSVPSILRDTPTPEPTRDPHFTDANLVTEIEKIYPLVRDDSYSVSIDGDYDNITARVIDSKDGTATYKNFIAYDDKGTSVLKEVK